MHFTDGHFGSDFLDVEADVVVVHCGRLVMRRGAKTEEEPLCVWRGCRSREGDGMGKRSVLRSRRRWRGCRRGFFPSGEIGPLVMLFLYRS